jgi:hypothetical protein
MAENTREDFDKFQLLTHHVAHAIDSYFMGAHPAPLINSVHAAHLILKDLANAAVNDGFFENIEAFEFFTDQLDQSANRNGFSRKRVNNVVGHYHNLGNDVKHADRHPDQLVRVSSQNAFEYLHAVVRDYRILRDKLLEVGVVERYSAYSDYQPPGIINKMSGSLTRKFCDFAGLGYRRPIAPKPYVDIASDLFLDWLDRIENYVGPVLLKQDKKKLHPRHALPMKQRYDLDQDIRGALANTAFYGLRQRFTNGVGKQEVKREILDHVKIHMREGSKYMMRKILDDITRNHAWLGCGYAKKIDHREPFENIWHIDPDGYDYIVN